MLNRSLVDEWIKTDDEASLKMSRRLLKEEGLMCGGSSGAAMHACLLAAKQLGEGQRVVVILPDSTRNYMSKFVADEWMVKMGLEPASLLTQTSAYLGMVGSEADGAVESGDASEADAMAAEWWASKTAVDLRLPAPITVPPSMACADAAEVMREHGIDQLPVVDKADGVVGVLTLGHLSSKLLGRAVAPRDDCSKLMFTQFSQVPLAKPRFHLLPPAPTFSPPSPHLLPLSTTFYQPSLTFSHLVPPSTTFSHQVPLATPLSAFSRIFERDAFCLVVTPMRHVGSERPVPSPSKKVVVSVCTQVDLLKFVMDGPSAAASRAAKAPPHPQGRHAGAAFERGNEMDCAQLAWQFMKTARPFTLGEELGPMASSLPSPAAGWASHSSPMSVGSANELHCAQLAWQFMKPKPSVVMRGPPPPSPPAPSSPDAHSNNDMHCAQLAWQFMKPPPKAAPTTNAPPTSPEPLAEHPVEQVVEQSCAQLAWQFMKPKPGVVMRGPPPPSPPAPSSPDAHSNNDMHCAQLAWQFMKPPTPNRSPKALVTSGLPSSGAGAQQQPTQPAAMHYASPALHTTPGAGVMPKLDMAAVGEAMPVHSPIHSPVRQAWDRRTREADVGPASPTASPWSAADESSAQATRFASPVVKPATPSKSDVDEMYERMAMLPDGLG